MSLEGRAGGSSHRGQGRNRLYLEDIPRTEAQDRFRQAISDAGLWRLLGSETIPLDEHALGRITAAPVWAAVSSPHYHAAAMDGYAVAARTTHSAAPTSPTTLIVSAAETAPVERAVYVDTGDALPEWADAVIPIEHVEPLDAAGQPAAEVRSPAHIRTRSSVAPWSHVRPMGEDIVATQLVIAAGHVLRAVDLGAIAAAGHATVDVALRPRVGIIPTGSELIPPGTPLLPGAILEYNSIVLAAQINEMGGVAKRYPIVQDDVEKLSAAVIDAARENDLILLNAGSSAGAEDFSSTVIAKLGVVLVHGVAVRPGHPVILGMLAGDHKSGQPARPVIGVPGYPVSAALTVEIFARPLMEVWLGRPPVQPRTVRAELTRKVTSPPGDEEHMRVVLGQVGDRLLAAPLPAGAGVITSLVQADGIMILPPGVQGMEAGQIAAVHIYGASQALDRTIFCQGSHDVTLDVMAQFLNQRGRRLVSANVGSVGGLVALRRGIAHMAGSHLLDPSSGEYNLAHIRQYMPGIPVKVISLALRQQGLMVRRGNPKHIVQLSDLAGAGVRYVNRQRGSGTRVLLDHHLDKEGIPGEAIGGYDHEEYTHLAVAAAIASGRADCGLGIAAAAQSLGLDFVPLYSERYDLVMRKEEANSELMQPLIELLEPGSFRTEVARMPGYDTSVMGNIVLED